MHIICNKYHFNCVSSWIYYADNKWFEMCIQAYHKSLSSIHEHNLKSCSRLYWREYANKSDCFEHLKKVCKLWAYMSQNQAIQFDLSANFTTSERKTVKHQLYL